MSTSNVNITDTEYTQICAVDCFITNESSYAIKIFSSVTQPPISSEGAFSLMPTQGFLKNGIPSNPLWGLGTKEGVIQKVSVNE